MIYLDNNATTRPAQEAVDAALDALQRAWANPSSVHRAGQEARRLVELAREEVARLIGARPRDITFTSGGTEAIDLAVRGVLAARQGGWVSTAIEHAAVRDLCRHLGESGRPGTLLPLTAGGLVDITRLAECIKPGTALVSVQWANNETGAIQPIAAVAARCRAVGAVFHCDATQYVGKMPVDLSMPSQGGWPDLLTFSPHKFQGVKGVGVLHASPGVPLAPVILGTQERGRRGGTENVSGIAAAAAAARLAARWLSDPGRRAEMAGLRDQFEHAVQAGCPGATVNGPADPAQRLWNTTNIAFPGLEAEALLLAMSERGLAASAGAACSSGSLEPSPVLLAMGIPERLAHGSIRFSLSRETTASEVDRAVAIVVESVRRVSVSMG